MHSASLVADFSQLQTVQFPLSRHLGGMREGGVGWYCGEQRAVHNRAAACVAAGGGILRKPALRTDKFKLKAISRS